MKLVLCFSLLLSSVFAANGQISKDFEGTITYRYTKFNSEGLPVSFPQEVEELHVSSTKMLVQTISGQIKYALGYDLLLDIDSRKRYEVYHNEKKLLALPAEPPQQLNMASAHELESQQILKRDCKRISIQRLHNQSKDTVTYIYYFNDEIKKSDLKEFAALQGNQNTIFLDGRYQMIPLKVEMNYSDHTRIVIEAIDIRAKLNPKTFNFSSYDKSTSQ